MTPLVDLASIPQVPCRWQRLRAEPWVQICVHEAITDDWSTGLNIARYLQDPKLPDGSPNQAGIHYSVGPFDVAQSADPSMTVPHCYRPSAWSLGVEHTGRTDDDVPPPPQTIRRSASLAGGLIVEWERVNSGCTFPIVHRDVPSDVAGKLAGFISHYDATKTCQFYGWPTIGAHHDGQWWPWPDYFDAVADDLRVRRGTKSVPVEGDEVQTQHGFILAGSHPNLDGSQAHVIVDPNTGQVHGWHGVTFDGVGSDAIDEAYGGGLRTVDFTKFNGGNPILAWEIDDATGEIVAFGGVGGVFRVRAVAG